MNAVEAPPTNEWARRFHTFRFPGYVADLETGVVELVYEVLGDDDVLRFIEVVEFPLPETHPAPEVAGAFHKVLDLLYVAAGVSYYKVAAPPELLLDEPRLSQGALPFLTDVYTLGLGEFAYRNNLRHVLDLRVNPVAECLDAPALALGDTSRPLVAVGGGKDSIVSIEATRRAGMNPTLFAVNGNRVIADTIAVSGLPHLGARRRIDPQLFELNAGPAYNGHIPVTAINSLIAVATSVLHGLGPVVMSNERSASDPNLVWDGHEINHQWSKGLHAEAGLRAALTAHVGLSDAYFSLLRPLSELHIAKLFSTIEEYDAVVTSCNAAFKLRGASERWCGDCPKCRFVFLALAPFTERARLVGIFGKDMLADAAQIPGYRELVGLDSHKPFECVGETEECLVALRLLVQSGQWGDAAVVTHLDTAVPIHATDAHVRETLGPAAIGFVPPKFQEAVDALG